MKKKPRTKYTKQRKKSEERRREKQADGFEFNTQLRICTK